MDTAAGSVARRASCSSPGCGDRGGTFWSTCAYRIRRATRASAHASLSQSSGACRPISMAAEPVPALGEREGHDRDCGNRLFASTDGAVLLPPLSRLHMLILSRYSHGAVLPFFHAPVSSYKGSVHGCTEGQPRAHPPCRRPQQAERESPRTIQADAAYPDSERALPWESHIDGRDG